MSWVCARGWRETIRLLAVTPEETISRFFAAMNAHDGDAAAALVDPEVEVAFGPEVFAGRDAVRELAEQEHPELVFETLPVSFDAQADGVEVVARRVQRWRETERSPRRRSCWPASPSARTRSSGAWK